MPKVTGQDYEKGITSSVQPPLYYCENAMVISHDGRNGKTIVYDLRNIDKGEIVGSNKWNNNFLIYPGTKKITGGNNVVNRFVLVNIVFSKMNDKFPLWYYQPKVVSLYIYTLEV